METITEQQPRLTGPEVEKKFRDAVETELQILYGNSRFDDPKSLPRLRMWRDQVECKLLEEVLTDLDEGRITNIGFRPKGFPDSVVYAYDELDAYGYDFKYQPPSRAERAKAKGHDCEENAVRRVLPDRTGIGLVALVCGVCGDTVQVGGWAPTGDTTTEEFKGADQPF